MDLIPILSTIILIATIITLVIAISAYVVFRIKEKQRGQAKGTVQVNLNPTAGTEQTPSPSPTPPVAQSTVPTGVSEAPKTEPVQQSAPPPSNLTRAQSILAAAVPDEGSGKPAEQPSGGAATTSFRMYKPPTQQAGQPNDSGDMWK